MDVQSDTTDPPSSESQPSGGKKKGFKLFGKRKPGSIFSIRGRGEEKDPAAEVRNKASEGSPESVAGPDDPEREPQTEHPTEEQWENGPADADRMMMAAAPPRHSICSVTSAKSLGFLLRIRAGRKGGRRERQVPQTVSQPTAAGPQRRGIKGLFSSVKFPPNKNNNKEDDKAEVPPSPLLMPSRSNSVEIIKEDLTLTPRPTPRNANSSSESESYEPASQDCSSQLDVPRVPVSPSSAGTPLEPGDASLSSLLADISSLLTFDSITTGGDIMADIAAEWDKASAAISARDDAAEPAAPSPKPVRSSPVTCAPSLSAVTSTSAPPAARPPLSSFTPTVNPPAASLSSQPFRSLSAGVSVSPASGASTFITVRSSPAGQKFTATPPSTLVTLTSFSTPPVMTSTLITTKPPPYPTTTPAKPPAPVVHPPYTSPLTLSSTTTAKPMPEAIVPVATPTPLSFAKPAPVAHSLPSTLPLAPSDKLDSRNAPPSAQSSSAKQPPYVPSSFTAAEPKASVSATCPVQAKLPCSAPVSISTTTPVPSLPATTVTSAKHLCSTGLANSEKNALSSFLAPSAASGFSSTSTTPVSYTKPPSIPTPGPAATPATPAVKTAAAAALVDLDKTPSGHPASRPLPASEGAVPVCTLSSTSRTPVPGSTAPSLASVGPAPGPNTPPLPTFWTPTPINPTPTPAPITPTPASKAPTPTPITPTPASNAPTPAPITPTPAPDPMTCTPASKTPILASTIPTPFTPTPAHKTSITPTASSVTPTPDPIVTKPAPAPPTPLPVTPTPAPMTCTPASKTPTPAPMTCTPASKTPTPFSAIPTPITPTPSSVTRTADPIVTKPAPTTPTPVSISVSLPKTSSPPTTTITPGPGRLPASADPVPAILAGMNEKGCPAPAESQQTSHPGPFKDRRAPPGKLVGLSKIPVVGGGRAGKLPIRDSHPPAHADNGDRSPDPLSPTPAPTPAPTPEDERPCLGPQGGGGRAKQPAPHHHHQEESQLAQHPQPPRGSTSSLRDSKIPVKHGSQPREAPRSKIPTSKVPVRRLGASKPAVASTTATTGQMRK